MSSLFSFISRHWGRILIVVAASAAAGHFLAVYIESPESVELGARPPDAADPPGAEERAAQSYPLVRRTRNSSDRAAKRPQPVDRAGAEGAAPAWTFDRPAVTGMPPLAGKTASAVSAAGAGASRIRGSTGAGGTGESTAASVSAVTPVTAVEWKPPASSAAGLWGPNLAALPPIEAMSPSDVCEFGRLAVRQGDLGTAVTALRACADLDPSQADALRELSRCLLALGNRPAALEAYRKFLSARHYPADYIERMTGSDLDRVLQGGAM